MDRTSLHETQTGTVVSQDSTKLYILVLFKLFLDVIKHVTSRGALISLNTSITAIEEQFLDDHLVVVKVFGLTCQPFHCNVQWRLPLHVLYVAIGAKLEQKLHIHELLAEDGKV